MRDIEFKLFRDWEFFLYTKNCVGLVNFGIERKQNYFSIHLICNEWTFGLYRDFYASEFHFGPLGFVLWN